MDRKRKPVPGRPRKKPRQPPTRALVPRAGGLSRRPKVNRRQGTTAAFSPGQARALLDAPTTATLQGLRDRAILSVGLQVGPRRSEIAGLKVKDFHENAGYPALHFIRKGGEDHAL